MIADFAGSDEIQSAHLAEALHTHLHWYGLSRTVPGSVLVVQNE